MTLDGRSIASVFVTFWLEGDAALEVSAILGCMPEAETWFSGSSRRRRKVELALCISAPA